MIPDGSVSRMDGFDSHHRGPKAVAGGVFPCLTSAWLLLAGCLTRSSDGHGLCPGVVGSVGKPTTDPIAFWGYWVESHELYWLLLLEVITG